jgi:putative colanic acid biosynthesis acetyltransferase WcaF
MFISEKPKREWSSLRYRNRLSVRNKLGRFLWNVVWLLFFRPTPSWTMHWWRRMLLRAFGARIGKGSKVRSTCRIWLPRNLTMGSFSCLADDVDCYCVASITIGSHVTVSQGAFLCTASHDIAARDMRLTNAPIHIQSQAWVAARAFIGPGVTIGEGAVVGACAVVMKDVPPWTVVSGNPAKFIKKRELKSISKCM